MFPRYGTAAHRRQTTQSLYVSVRLSPIGGPMGYICHDYEAAAARTRAAERQASRDEAARAEERARAEAEARVLAELAARRKADEDARQEIASRQVKRKVKKLRLLRYSGGSSPRPKLSMRLLSPKPRHTNSLTSIFFAPPPGWFAVP
jgi:hypothetical protein